MATRTYKYHPPIYYTIRSIVRFVFWTTIATAVTFALVMGAERISEHGMLPVCDVTVDYEDFTWVWNGTPTSLSECRSPEDIVLLDNHYWEWYDPIIHG